MCKKLTHLKYRGKPLEGWVEIKYQIFWVSGLEELARNQTYVAMWLRLCKTLPAMHNPAPHTRLSICLMSHLIIKNKHKKIYFYTKLSLFKESHHSHESLLDWPPRVDTLEWRLLNFCPPFGWAMGEATWLYCAGGWTICPLLVIGILGSSFTNWMWSLFCLLPFLLLWPIHGAAPDKLLSHFGNICIELLRIWVINLLYDIISWGDTYYSKWSSVCPFLVELLYHN